MKAVTKRNLKQFIMDYPEKFPDGFEAGDIENLSSSVINDLITKLAMTMGYRQFIRVDTITLTKKDFENVANITFSNTLLKRLSKPVEERAKAEKEKIMASMPKPTWAEIPQPQQNNFRRWVVYHAKDYDEKFTGPLYDKLSDEIKLEFYFELAKRFGVQNYQELRTFKRSSNDMNMGVKKLKITDEIQEAIYDVIPVDSGILKTIRKTDMDNWSAEEAVATADSYTQEEIDAAREKRKFDKKRAKLIARVKSMKSLEQYNTTMNDELFDRGMFEIILDRMNNGTAFKDTWNEPDSKEIIKLIVNHSMATTKDLMRIKNMKTTQWGGKSAPRYNSSYLNSALANKSDAPIDELMKLIKLQQYDLKLNVMKRQDLSEADKGVIVEYTIRHHSHVPEQLKAIFKAGGKEDLLEKSVYRDSIIAELKKKYTKGNGWSSKPNGLKFLEVMDSYGWFGDLTERDRKDMGKVIAKAYEEKRLSKERIIKLIDRLTDNAADFLTLLYEETGDEDFLPNSIRDIFIF